MRRTQFDGKLSQDEIYIQNKSLKIRTINIPYNSYKSYHFYSKLNLLAECDFLSKNIYFINENNIVLDEDLTKKLIQNSEGSGQVLFLENHIVVYKDNRFIKFNIEKFEYHETFSGRLRMQGCFYQYGQINEKSFYTISTFDDLLRIYQLRNFKYQHTSLNKFRVTSIQYHKHIVQAFTDENLYYYNTKMTKQIRKYNNHNQDEFIFNSNYLFVPTFNERGYLIILTIYDIQNMKRIGTIVTIERNQVYCGGCILIRDYNLVGVLYKTRLDLYDFITLKFIDSLSINNQFEREKFLMNYDQQNGLKIFIKR